MACTELADRLLEESFAVALGVGSMVNSWELGYRGGPGWSSRKDKMMGRSIAHSSDVVDRSSLCNLIRVSQKMF